MPVTKQTFANLGITTVSVANPNLNGTGALSTVISGNYSGTRIRSIIIKAQQSTSEGTVRLYVTDGVNINLFKEIPIPAVKQSSEGKTFEYEIDGELNLNPGYSLLASTQKAERINIIADGSDSNFCNCSEGVKLPIQIASTGAVTIQTANAHLDGTGAMGTVISADTVNLYGGLAIGNVNIKAIKNTKEGMVRLFIGDGVINYLITEIKIPASTATALEPSFRTDVFLGLYLRQKQSLYASTELDDSFTIIAEGLDFHNCEC